MHILRIYDVNTDKICKKWHPGDWVPLFDNSYQKCLTFVDRLHKIMMMFERKLFKLNKILQNFCNKWHKRMLVLSMTFRWIVDRWASHQIDQEC